MLLLLIMQYFIARCICCYSMSNKINKSKKEQRKDLICEKRMNYLYILSQMYLNRLDKSDI